MIANNFDGCDPFWGIFAVNVRRPGQGAKLVPHFSRTEPKRIHHKHLPKEERVSERREEITMSMSRSRAGSLRGDDRQTEDNYIDATSDSGKMENAPIARNESGKMGESIIISSRSLPSSEYFETLSEIEPGFESNHAIYQLEVRLNDPADPRSG
jgi:hypothetical protein